MGDRRALSRSIFVLRAALQSGALNGFRIQSFIANRPGFSQDKLLDRKGCNILKTVLFDCDGTLVSSMPQAIRLTTEIANQFAPQPVTLEWMEKNFDQDLVKLSYKLGITDPDIGAKWMARWDELVRKNPIDFELFEGVRPMLEFLDQASVALYVWTGRDRYSTQQILKRFEISHFFKEVSTASDDAPKPNPAGAQRMLDHISPEDTVMIGDSYADMLAAKHCGAYPLGACWCPSADSETLNSFGAQALAYSPQQCIKLLQQILKI